MSDRGTRRTIIGTVTSTGMDKTVKVRSERRVQHPRYGKIVRRWTDCMVHDEEGQAHLGDKVMIMECRPLSKNKHWRLVKVLESREI